jgi:hypothetical protein
MNERAGAEHYGPELGESGQAKTERLLAEELRRARWTAADGNQDPPVAPALLASSGATRSGCEKKLTILRMAEPFRALMADSFSGGLNAPAGLLR